LSRRVIISWIAVLVLSGGALEAQNAKGHKPASKPPAAKPGPQLSQQDLSRMVVYKMYDRIELWDAVEGRKVLDHWPDGESSLALGNPAKLLIGCDTCLDRHQVSNLGKADPALKLGLEQVRAILFSPDAKRIVLEKNSDLWLGDIDWASGTVRNPRQITQAGVFNGGERYWHGEYLLYEGYRVSIADQAVKEAKVGWYQLEKRISPDRRTVVYQTADRMFMSYDLVTDEHKELRPNANSRDYLWLDDDRAVTINWNRDIWLFDRRENALTVAIPDLNLQDGLIGPSPGGRYFGCTEFMGQERLLIIDSSDWSIVPVTKGIKDVQWVNADHFLFTREEPIEQRGTWLFDMATKTEKKVSPYPYVNIAILPEAQRAVFTASSNLWAVKLDGTELKQLTTTDNERGTLRTALPNGLR